MTKTQTTLSAKFLDFLGRTHAGRPLNDVERLIVEETWVRAAMLPKASAPTIIEIATAHAKFGDPLLERVTFVREVIHNTLQKMSGEVPPELAWASHLYPKIVLGGIRRTEGYSRYSQNISYEIERGQLVPRDSDCVRVIIIKSSNGRLDVTTDIPLSSLSSSSTIVAQMTRAACKRHAAKSEAEAFTAAKKGRGELAAQIAELQRKLTDLDELVAVKAAEERVRADEMTARARVKAAERTAVREARHAAEITDAEG